MDPAHLYLGCLSFAASEIAADEIAAKNWPPMQRADILNRPLAFHRFKFTPPRKSPPPITMQCSKLDLYTLADDDDSTADSGRRVWRGRRCKDEANRGEVPVARIWANCDVNIRNTSPSS